MRVHRKVFNFRATHVQGLSAELRPQVIARYLQHLLDSFGARLTERPETELRHDVAEALSRAHSYGLTRPDDETRFLNLAASFGWCFDQDIPWVGPMLRDPEIRDATERLRRVKARFVRQLQIAQQNTEAREAFGS